MQVASTEHKGMNYLNHLPDPIKPMGSIHPKLRKAFFAFLLNDHYRILSACKKKKIVTLVHPTRGQVTITSSEQLNAEGKKRYQVFFKVYFKKGSAFIDQLNSQIHIRVAA
ncbi:hypothetical protein HADU_04193 [Acinetobacter sp. HA]|uniref:hypothetical protein n=1 Tax=Acinetobacter sp. HA TaxID=1173062 RepID=UPI000263DEDC|nr:hypothetical protein [Acinetobacter sp. HA]EIM40027.1 hypothetical protein HADU_04193 [Acinetobacter sp. HA]